MNSVSLEVTAPQAVTAGQQLIVTAEPSSLVMVVWVFGYTGGKQLVGQSYTDAKEKAAEQSAAHKARRAEKKSAKQTGEQA